MNKVIAPLEINSRGREVVDLQDALVVLLKRRSIVPPDEVQLRNLSEGLDRERGTETYGDFTAKLVDMFRRPRRLGQGGNVDERTANAINALLEGFGLFQPPPPVDRSAVVSGQVRDENSQPLKGRVVRAFHEADGVSIRLGEDTTDAAGSYTIRYDLLPNVESINLRVSLIGDEDQPQQSSEIIRNARALEIVNLTVPVAAEADWRVFGTVSGIQNDPADRLFVHAIDRDLRNEQLLGKSEVNAGRYEIAYSRAQFRLAEKDSADLVLKVFDSQEREIHKTPIHFNAPRELELNIVLDGASASSPSEWELLNRMLMPLLEGVTPLELREDDQFQDISFLAGETGKSPITIALWILCFRLADKSEREEMALDREVFFAFLRQGQPFLRYDTLLDDMRLPDRMVLLEDKILRGIGSIASEVKESILKTAVDSNLVPLRSSEQIKKDLEVLHEIHLKYEAETTFGGGKGTINQLLEITPAAKEQQVAFMTAFTAHQGPIKAFWKQLAADEILPAETVQKVRLSFEVGSLVRNHVPLVSEIVKRFDSGEISEKRELAKLAPSDWKALFTQPTPEGQAIGVPINIDGATDEAKMDQFATILVEQFQRAYPTTAFSGNLARTELSPLRSRTGVVQFLEGNPTLQLDRVRLDHYLADNENAFGNIADKTSVVADLKSIQRVFKLNPSFKVVDALLTRKIDSSQKIYFMGETQFLKRMEGSEVNKIEAKKLYRKAENAYAHTLALFGDYNVALNGATPLSVAAPAGDPGVAAKIAALPNLQTLFGSLDFCECVDCRSVYSPAAYFLDVLRFLGERGTQGSGINAGKTVRDVLLERRPDLGEIELSCENTNTPLPYIDLVNEILEDVVAPPAPVTLADAIEADLVAGPIKPAVIDELIAKGVTVAADAQSYDPDIRGQWVIRDGQSAYKVRKAGDALQLLPTHQTFLSAAELRANPEHTTKAAYDKLKGEVFPLNMPFDLWNLQVRTYLDHLGVPRPRLLELFTQKPGASTSQDELPIDCAWLNLTESERQIITGKFPGKELWEFWGLSENANDLPNPENPADATQNVTGTWIEVLGHVNVMLNRSGLSYKELLQLLDMRYVNRDGSLSIFDTADVNAANCDTSTFTIRNLTADSLDRTNRFIRLWRKLGCEMWELDLMVPDKSPDPELLTDVVVQNISAIQRLRERTGLDWRTLNSFYNGIDNEIYFDRSKDGAPPLQTPYQSLFRNKLVDAVASFPPTPAEIGGPIAKQIPGILAAVQINEVDLNLILKQIAGAPITDISANILHEIYRISALAQALGLSIDEFLRIKRLSASDPFANPRATQQFIDLIQQVGDSGISVLELDYLLSNSFTSSSGAALDDRRIVEILKSLREGIQKINDGVRRKTEETNDAYVKSKLGLLPLLGKDTDQIIALGIIDGTWVGTEIERKTLIGKFFTGVVDLAEAEVQLNGAGPGPNPHFNYFQPVLEAFLLKTQQESFVHEKLAEVFQLDVPTTNLLLTQLETPGTSKTLLQSINDVRLLGTISLEESNFKEIFKGLRLLHKNALVITRLRMNAEDVRWWLEGNRAADLGWVQPQKFPLESATTPTGLEIKEWLAMQQFFGWREKLPKSTITAFEFVALLDQATSSAAIAELSKLTTWSESDITALAKQFGWIGAAPAPDTVTNELKKSASLIRLAECMKALRRLGVNAARAIEWAGTEPASEEADSLKQTVKSKYDLTQWQQVIKPLQDEVREQKRQALVSWLVVHPDKSAGQNWSDANGLYSYFLIDVEMSACMMTSRLKQAAASAQLFVQRCLLNLEKDILAKTDLDSKWKQWKWMKQYRVWEANRKVFLYPENWIEPELRIEKSPFFKDLENELAQNDISNESAEQAYLNYLEKLDKVANLEIRTLYNQDNRGGESVLHVFGRTRSSQAPEHFYRKRINRGRWTPWEKVDLEISANHLVTGVLNRRLYLLWPQFLAKADPPPATMKTPTESTETPIVQPNKYWEIRLFWSELKKGKWTPKVLSDSFVRIDQHQTGGDFIENIDFSARFGLYIPITVLHSSNPDIDAPTSADGFFGKVGKQVNRYPMTDTSETFLAPKDSRYVNNLLQHNKGRHYFGHFSFGGGKIAANVRVNPQAADQSTAVLNKLNGVTYSVVDLQGGETNPVGSFFLWDTERVYFIDYTRSEGRLYTSRGRRTTVSATFNFFIHYHPFVELFIKELNIWGLKGLLNRRIQISPATIPDSPPSFSFSEYQPTANVTKNYKLPDGTFGYPVEDVDFTYTGAYAPYNWELFFHVPFFIANKLSTNQRFEEALEWFHYIFDPTNTDNTLANPDTPQQKFWITKPFFETTKAEYYKQKIENIMLAIAKGDLELRKQVEEWRNNPFDPHLIARMRTVAYQKNLLIKYIQTLIAWGDQLFRRDTIETVNEATQLYILAASVLGPRPKSIPKQVTNPIKNFYQLQKEGIDGFGNVLKEVENLLPAVSATATMGDAAPELPHLDVLYFCIPNNDKLLTLWDTVADRLFKIRHCMNIEGVVRQLPLFEPPIDPALLVKATAAGLDISAALAEVNAPLPLYRFTFMIQRALEICSEVKSLGAAMLSALEKRDAEDFALLRSSHEGIMLDQVKLVKTKQVEEALRAREALDESRKVIEERKQYYEGLANEGLNDWEKISLALSGGAIISEIVGTVLNAIGSGTSMIPEVNAGAAGFGGSPHMTLTLGGKSVTSGLSKAADVAKGVSSILQMSSSLSSTVGSYNRRADEWNFQARLATKDLPPIDRQRVAAQIRHEIAIQDLANQEKLAEHALAEKEYLSGKFTNRELYDWMINQLSTIYFQSYQIAFDIAKRAERCFRYELGLSDSSYIQFGYWDSLKKGLLSGERLFFDLKRLEASYYEQNRRDLELTKYISLSQLDPVALLKLRQTGECFVDIPETAFDMDYPGHYFRRLKTVGISIPCVVGPHTTVACTLTLVSNQLRKDAQLLGGVYERTSPNDLRFRDEIATIQSIATSNGQNDHGLFELNFRDERYLPFEGAGAISSWHIKLNQKFPQFDYASISNLVLQIVYTARDGGGLLQQKAEENFSKKLNEMALAENQKGLFRVFDLRREFSTEWSRFLRPLTAADDQTLVLENLQERLPFFTRQFKTKKVSRVQLVAQMKVRDAKFQVSLSTGGAFEQLPLLPAEGFHQAAKDLGDKDLGTWSLKIQPDGAVDFKSLPVDAIEELFLIVNYKIA